jgi:ribosome-associated protein
MGRIELRRQGGLPRSGRQKRDGSFKSSRSPFDRTRSGQPRQSNIVEAMDELTVGNFTIPDAELEEEFTTSGGPGGQHANRSNTAVEIRFDLRATGAFPASVRDRLISRLGEVVTAMSSDSRSQWRNRALARQWLAERLEEAMRPPKRRRPTKPSATARRKRLESKRRQSEKKRLRKNPEW